jgi:hypothetical protein
MNRFQTLLSNSTCAGTVRLRGTVIQAHLGMNMRVMMVFGCLAMGYYAVAVPAAHRFVLTRRTALAVMCAYLAFTAAFVVVALEEGKSPSLVRV